MQSIKNLENLTGKRVLLRAGFDVPIKDGKVEDPNRIRALIPTIQYISERTSLIILSHQGRPKGKIVPELSLKLLIPTLEEFLNKKIIFADSCLSPETKSLAENLKKGEILLLENLRFNPEEEANDDNFAQELAKLGDVYVDEAFPVAHREQASITALPKYLPSYAGLQFEEEVKNLSKALEPEHPFLFILGGAKFETKMPLIKKYLKSADSVFIGGALLNDFLKAKGYEVGQSTVSDSNYGIEKILKNKKLILPIDVLTQNDTNSAYAENVSFRKITEIKKDETIIDVGPSAEETLAPLIKKSKLILWNGPLGKYETKGGDQATKNILKLVLESKAQVIIGGGDTIGVLSELEPRNYKLAPNVFVSTGGGATLDFLANGTLPGIKALK